MKLIVKKHLQHNVVKIKNVVFVLKLSGIEKGDKRFGILENCDHIFCLECIRKWRASSNYDNKVVKAW